MPDFKDLVQKAFYLGVGAASYAAEKAGTTLADLKVQAQKLADEMVARGEITAEEAKRMVDEMVIRAQQVQSNEDSAPAEPRRIEIVVEEDEPAATSPSAATPTPTPAPTPSVEDLRQQVAKLQEELRQLRKD